VAALANRWNAPTHAPWRAAEEEHPRQQNGQHHEDDHGHDYVQPPVPFRLVRGIRSDRGLAHRTFALVLIHPTAPFIEQRGQHMPVVRQSCACRTGTQPASTGPTGGLSNVGEKPETPDFQGRRLPVSNSRTRLCRAFCRKMRSGKRGFSLA
jgi:hypothetical protein